MDLPEVPQRHVVYADDVGSVGNLWPGACPGNVHAVAAHASPPFDAPYSFGRGHDPAGLYAPLDSPSHRAVHPKHVPMECCGYADASELLSDAQLQPYNGYNPLYLANRDCFVRLVRDLLHQLFGGPCVARL